MVPTTDTIPFFCNKDSHRIGGERRDASRESGHERVQFGVGQRPVDPAVPFGLVGVEVGRTENHLHGPAPPQQLSQVLHTTRARERTETDLGLPQYGVLSRDPNVLIGFQLSEQGHQVAHQFRSDQFIDGASIATHSTPSSLRATRSVRYVWVIVGFSTPARCRLKGTLTTD
jgi:hypothetical protein